MLKKLRWRFILSAMVSIASVMLILLLVLNVVNFSVTTRNLDRSLMRLSDRAENSDRPPVEFKDDKGGREPRPMQDEQDSFRSFAVFCDDDGNISEVGSNPFFSLEGTDAETLVPAVLAKNKTSGYYDGYRYLIKDVEGGSMVSFLSCAIEMQNGRNLLIASCIVAAVSLLAVFGLVVALSKRAIDPYVKNIEQQKRFITDAGHELKTPITSIATSADVLSVELENNEWVENIKNQTVRLTRLVGDLITLSRLDEENPFPEKTEFSLSDAVWEITEPFESLAKAKGKHYIQNIEDGITISGSKASVQQMVSILLDNAVKYSDEGGTIQLNVSKTNKGAVIDVFNTCNIPDISDLDKVFDRFYRLDKSRSKNTGGTGVGLSIAKATAEAMGGKIKVSSQSGKTIRFTVTL